MDVCNEGFNGNFSFLPALNLISVDRVLALNPLLHIASTFIIKFNTAAILESSRHLKLRLIHLTLLESSISTDRYSFFNKAVVHQPYQNPIPLFTY